MTTLKIADAPANSFSEGDLRFYTWKGENYPSVTTIRRMAGMPWMLHNWVVNQTINAAIGDPHRLADMMDRALAQPAATDIEKSVKAVKAWLRKQAAGERDAAANLGTRVHSVVSTGREPLEDEAPFVKQYRDWLDKSKAVVLHSERQVWNLKLGYAGSFDLMVELPDGQIVVVDVKTGKNTYTDHAIQGVAYALGEFIGENDKVDETATALLKAASGVAILHLRPEGWEWEKLRLDNDLYRAFAGLLAFAKFSHAHPRIDDLLVARVKGSAK